VEEPPFASSQGVRLPAGQGEPPQVMALWAETECGECKRGGAKLIFRGEAELHMLLQEPGGGLTADVERLPLSQVPGGPEGGAAPPPVSFAPIDTHRVSSLMRMYGRVSFTNNCRRALYKTPSPALERQSPGPVVAN